MADVLFHPTLFLIHVAGGPWHCCHMAKAQNALLLQALGLGTHLVPLITHAKQNNLRRPSRTWLMLRILMSILKHACS